MRLLTFPTKPLCQFGMAAVAMSLIGCKGDLGPDPAFDDVPPVGQSVGAAGAVEGAVVPAQIDPINFGIQDPAMNTGLAGSPEFASPQPAVPDPVFNIPTTEYEIVKGDTLSKIAVDHGTNISTLQKLNNIKGTFIRYGQKIKVPDPSGVAAVPDSAGLGVSTPLEAPPSTFPSEITPPPADTLSPAGGSTLGGETSGFGFGGESVPRPRTPSRLSDDFLDVPAPN